MEVGREKIVGRIQYLFKIAFAPHLTYFPARAFVSVADQTKEDTTIYLILSGEEFELSTFVPVSEVADED